MLAVQTRRFFHTSRNRWSEALTLLTPYDISCILRENEYTHDFSDGSIKGYDSNQLSSNSPIEDSRCEATFTNKNGFICGVFDGHGGPSCSQVISKRLLRYIAASVLDKRILNEFLSREGNSSSLLQCYNDKVDFVKEVKSLYEESFQKFAKELNEASTFKDTSEAIEHAFNRLDKDMSDEALQQSSIRTMAVAMSGAVACVALVEDNDLYVANTGDCAAVLGTLTDTGQWETKKLSHEHNSDNVLEMNRIVAEHPDTEKESVIRNERLLGQLAPLRALGDFRFKWSNQIMQDVVVPQFGEAFIPHHYYTPPYLTAMPDIIHHKLTPNDSFMVIGSDGLWDFLSPMQVVSLVGDHIAGKAFLQPLKLPSNEVTFGQISEILAHRKAGRKKKPQDKNAATHLIRHALGGTEYGIEHSKLSHLLSLPQDVVRLYRDDITLTVVFFNKEVLRQY